jgi:hypothetical protein
MMERLTTDLLGQACRIFLPLAYPGDEGTIPAKKRCFLQLPAGESMLTRLTRDPAVGECCQVLHKDGKKNALLVRLGCVHYPHLKLKVQCLNDDQGDIWVFAVDTHDAFSKTSFLPPADHPDRVAWEALQLKNGALKAQIEAAWEQAGLWTFKGLLRRDLANCQPSQT